MTAGVAEAPGSIVRIRTADPSPEEGLREDARRQQNAPAN